RRRRSRRKIERGRHREAVTLLEMKDRTFAHGISYQPAMCGGDGLRSFFAAVIEKKNFPKAAVAARQLVDNEGSIACLHEYAFLSEIEDLDMSRREQEGAVGVACKWLKPAEDGQR